MRKYLIVFLLTTLGFFSYAQHSGSGGNRQKLLNYQDSLTQISYQIINNSSETERYSNNYKFIKTLISALKIPQSFNFGFDSLKAISIQTSPDQRFRIFSWHVMNADGSYRYYGTIQMNSPQLKMYPLVDFSAGIKQPADTVTTNENWFGAQYYRIIPVTYNVRVPYYILLGWKGNTVRSTKKVIEVLYFKDNKAYFGMPVFDGDKERQGHKRIVFEYSRQVSMALNYSPKDGTIVFDHLVPPDPKMKGKYEVYGPDMSYDGFKLVNGRWKYVEDLPVKNPPSASDENFNDPRNPTNNTKRKLY